MQLATNGLAALIARLSVADPADTGAVVAALGATVAGDFTEFERFAEGRYTRVPLHRAPSWELLLLCWSAGSASPIHDHGESICVVRVLRGAVRVEDFTCDEDGRPVRSGEWIARVGDVDARRGPRQLHRVTAAADRTVTLHCYAPHLRMFTAYREDGRTIAASAFYDGEPER
jgi:cysteine dioxygenase